MTGTAAINQKRAEPVGAGRPTDSAVTRVYNRHTTLKTAAPSEKDSNCKKQGDKPNLVILKVRSKRENSLRALVDSGASNNFVRQQSLPKLNFEDVDTSRSVLEVRLATGATVRTEKRGHLEDKFDLVLGKPWLAQHDPVVNWEKRTVVRFGRNATESDGPVSVAHAPQGASDHTVQAVPNAAAFGAQAQVATTERVVECESNPNLIGSDLPREFSDECVGVDVASSHELDALHEGPASPFYDVLWEPKDVLPDEIPAELPQDKIIQHEIDLVPSTKYCVARQWPLPRDQVKSIDDFFDSRRQAGQVRESKSPHSAPTFCVKKPQGGWRIVHAYNKLNDATIPAQTPIPRKDVIIDLMAKSTIYSALDLRDGFYQILMRESDITLTAVSTPSGMLWKWLVMTQGLNNAPATFNRCVTHLLRSVRDFAPSYFDDVFVHSRAVNGKTDVEVHKEHLRKVLGLMRKHKLYANLKKCIFGASEIPILGCLVGKNGVRPDPEKVRVINEWPTLSNVKELRQFLGLATYLCKYVENYAGKIRPLSQLLKKKAEWKWTAECQQAFDAVKQGLTEAPILAVADQDRPFHVVCDASDFAIGCALMQHDHEGRDRVIYSAEAS
ncbi:hypothetical protein PC119_g24702 [Phytophthora cactorum]|nr:hypothetical protein PC119_g24702 [Phytophthora cactorum]